MRSPRFLLTPWPWRSLAHNALTPLTGAGYAFTLLLVSLPLVVLFSRLSEPEPDRPVSVAALVAMAVGGGLLAGVLGPLISLPGAALERLRLRVADDRPLRSPHRVPDSPGLWPWLRLRFTEAATWRAFGYLVLAATVLPAAALYLHALLAGVHAALARSLLRAPGEELRAELTEVTRSRARLVDAFEAERRRIERDLHDGAQQRLVALTMELGLARLDLPPDSPAARQVASAHESAKEVIAELRELIRGIHPQVLTDRGLSAALPELADRCPVPVRVRTDLAGRCPAHIEGTAYFVVSEALANVAKHSGADAAEVTARCHGGRLVVEVRDDGAGGADPRAGTGLTGLADRVAVMDGRMLVSSPPGGPTLLRVELPCLPRG
ncbi:sensor histidine kinase [Streptomonospora nanhaiensis]|uniref:sensor histidine kinase n=1 Tax=Streptomonospora nanhaiensis TaxID=1323731 RepID=UPI0027E2DA18|nr:histidine kinase [Streptomonospora nanhaiensis]